jgi:hypothetical protein
MICDECETVAHCLKNGCAPKQPSKDEALKLSLEALENLLEQYYCNTVAGKDCDQAHDAITAIKQALLTATPLAAPVQQSRSDVEPVATKLQTQQFNCFHVSAEDFQRLKELPVGTKLYTTPPADEIQRLSALVRAQQITIEKLEAAHVPEGWKMVPMTPTQEMLAVCDEDVGSKIIDGAAFAGAVWAALLAAAPEKGQP